MRHGFALVAILLLPAAAGESARMDLEIHAARTLSAWGNVRLHATSAVLDLTNETTRGTVAIRWTHAHGYDVNDRVDQLPTGSAYGFDSPENLTVDLPAGELLVRDCLPPCQAALVVLPGSSIAVEGLPDGPLRRTEGRTFYHGYRDGGVYSFRAEVGDGWVEAPLAGASLHARGRLVLFLNGPVGELAHAQGSERFWSGFRTTPSTTLLGIPATHQEERRFLALVLEDAEAIGTRLHGGTIDAPEARVEAAERLEARSATGLLAYGAVRRSFEDAAVVVAGPVAGTVGSDAAAAPWRARFSGTASSVTLDAATLRPLPPAADAATLLAKVVGFLVLLLLLAKACAWALYSRLGPGDVLHNANRRAILDALKAAPGSRPAELARATGIHEAVVRYHLKRLQEAGLARAEDAGGARLWLAHGPASPPALDRVLAQRGVRGETVRRLAAALLGFPQGATQLEVSEATGVSRRLVSYHLQRLEEAALVTKRDGRPARFEPTDALRDALRAGEAE